MGKESEESWVDGLESQIISEYNESGALGCYQGKEQKSWQFVSLTGPQQEHSHLLGKKSRHQVHTSILQCCAL